MKKKRNNLIGKRIIAAMLCAFVLSTSIDPSFASYVYANSTEIQGVFNETLAEDKASATIDLRIGEVEDKTIESITLPDQSIVAKENFKKDDNNKLLFKYTATENKKLEYVVEYIEKKVEASGSTEQTLPQEATPEVKKEILTYEVKDIVAPKEPTLTIDAKDITYKVGEEVDFRKDVTIKDENDQDITNQLNFDIVSYDGYITDKVGTFNIKYTVKHPGSEEEFDFHRNLTVVENPKNNFDTKVKSNTTKGSIMLSSANASLNSPDKFVIGDATQDFFNISVEYVSTTAESDRTLQVTIPKNFTLVKDITTDNVASATSISKKVDANGTIITIIFADGVNTTANFDMLIQQQKYDLYKDADGKDTSYVFRLDGKSGDQVVFTESFSLDTKKLNSIKADDNVVLEYSDPKVKYTNINGESTIEYELNITKKKYSSLENITLNLPEYLNDIKGSLYGYAYIIDVSTGSPIDSVAAYNFKTTSDGTHVSIDLSSNKDIKMRDWSHSFEDRKIRLTYSFTGKYPDNFYDNGLFESSGNIALDGIKDYGKIKIDTTNSKGADIQFLLNGDSFMDVGSPRTVKQGGSFEPHSSDLSRSFFEIIDANDFKHKEVKISYEFPYEIKPTYVATRRGRDVNKLVKITTNNGNTYTTKQQVFFTSIIGSDEYVTKVEINMPLTARDDYGFNYNISTTDENGNVLPDRIDRVIKETIVSEDGKVSNTRDLTVTLVKQLDDVVPNALVKTYDKAAIQNGETAFASSTMEMNWKTQTYRDVQLHYEGVDVLALIDKIKLGDISKYHYRAIYDTFEAQYETNMQSGLSKQGVGGVIDFELSEGEYITSLILKFKELGVSISSFEGRSWGIGIEFFSKDIPEKNVLNGEELDGKYYNYKYTFESSNAPKKESNEGTTHTFRKTNVATIRVKDTSSTQIDGNTGSYKFPRGEIPLSTITIVPAIDIPRRVYRNAELNFSSSDPLLLSLIGSVSNIPTGGKLIFETNLGNRYERDNGKVDLPYGEYITELSIKVPEFKTETLTTIKLNKRVDYPRKSPIDDSYLGDEGKSYSVNMMFNADNSDEVDAGTEQSATISGKQNMYVLPSEDSVSVDIDSKESYQGEKLKVSSRLLIGEENPSYDTPTKAKLVNPIIYAEIDNRYVYQRNSIILTSDAGKEHQDYEVTYTDKKTIDGNSVLAIKLKNYENIHRPGRHVSLGNLEFELLVNPAATPGSNIDIVKNIWFDLSDSLVNEGESNKDYMDIVYKNTTKDTFNIQEIENKELIKWNGTNKKHQILQVSEMGVGSIGRLDSQLSMVITGHDNDIYEQELSLISNLNQKTKDWVVYIPVPKKGSSVKYTEVINGTKVVKDSEKALFSLSLVKGVEIPDMTRGTKIEYTTDMEPLYSLEGESVGNYTEVTSQWNDVTMIKITIPEMDAKEKKYPLITYKTSNDKDELGTQKSFGAAYCNLKLGDDANYYYKKEGSFSKLVDYNLIDFSLRGSVWEDRNEPSNSIYDRTDSGKPNVEVIATDKEGNEFTTKTGDDGSYNLTVPSHGKTEVRVILPNDLGSIPKKEYIFVKESQGTANTSSVVNQTTGIKEIEFKKTDIDNINAGVWAKRDVSVTPKDLVIAKGTTMPVPAVVFPSYSPISYQNTEDRSIATVNASGLLTGIELGETKATISIPDGQGGSGVVSATYNIKVVPADVPTAKSDSITTFQNGEFDATSGIEILDGDKKPISITDASKVTINTDGVDVSTPGRYPITYIINDGYNEVTVTRYVYVHGNIKLVVPEDITKKVGESVVALDGASATYIHINEDGTQTKKTVSVTTPNIEITSNVVGNVDVPLDARITVEGAEDTASGNYVVTFNEKAKIEVANDKVTIKVGASLDEIKNMINGNASMTTPDGRTDLTPNINWEILEDFDTSQPGNTITGKITVIDPDTGELIEKEITVTISGNVEINAPTSVDLVEGDNFNPYANVEIIDGDGDVVTLTPDMIISNTVPTDTDGKRGVYEVEYEYTDKYGNTKREKTTVNVHGKLQFDDTRRDFLQNDSVEDVNSLDANKDLAYYMDATGNKKLATFISAAAVSSDTIGKFTQALGYTHPVNGNDVTFNRAIYVHGHVSIQVPNTYTVKVNTEINTLKDVTASYQFVEDDGTIVDKTTSVSSSLGNKTTSAVPTKMVIPVEASVEVVAGLNSRATNNYAVIFNGMPTITTVKDSIEVRVGATFEEIKNIINASALVQYGDEINPTDLTAQINWDEVMAIDTSSKDKTYTVKLYVTDKDGATVEKTVNIKISNEIIMNLPTVDKVIGDTFDPKENVTIFDGQGNPVNLNDVIIDDSKVDMSKPGNYEVTYTYTDSLGNKETKVNTIKVHGELQFEGIERIDLIEKESTYIVDTAKAFYMNSDGKKVYVQGVYDKPVLDQSIIGKNELIYSAIHPINNVKESSATQNVFIHGDIVFHKPSDIPIGKVNTVLKPNTGVSATFDFVNDDGTITTKDVPVSSSDVTSNTVGYVAGKISAKVEVVGGLINSKDDTAVVGFNGLPYINAANTISYDGVVPSREDIINKILASAGIKQANGVVINLTENIDYSDVDRVVLDKNGNYQITLTVTDADGFTTYTVVNVIVNISTIKPEEPNIPVPPINPTNPVRPNIPAPPLKPVEKDTVAAVSRDIPLSEAKKNKITNDFIKSYITASTEKNGIINFEIISHNVLPKVGEYEVSIRLEDGSVLNVKLKVVDDGTTDVDQPEYGHDKDCIIHWIILLLFAGYSIYAIAAMLKCRKDNKDLEKALEEMGVNGLNGEGVEQDEN